MFLVALSYDGVLLPTNLICVQFIQVVLAVQQHAQRRRRRRGVKRRRRELKPEPETTSARQRHVGDKAVPARSGVDAAFEQARRRAVVTERHSSGRHGVVLDE